MDSGHTDQQGFTLIEIMIAVTLFAIGILAVASMQISGIRGNASASGLTEATTLAQDKLEELMALDYGNAALSDADGDGTNQDGNDDGVDDGGNDFGLDDDTAAGADGFEQISIGPSRQYSIFWNIAENEPVANNKTLRVIVTWTEGGRNRRVTMNTVKANM